MYSKNPYQVVVGFCDFKKLCDDAEEGEIVKRRTRGKKVSGNAPATMKYRKLLTLLPTSSNKDLLFFH